MENSGCTAPDLEVKAAIERLKEAAEKATPGPWTVNPVKAWIDVPDRDAPICAMLWPTDLRSEEDTFSNATFVALANPSAILSLISSYEERGHELTEADELNAMMRDQLTMAQDELSQAQDRICRLERCLADALAGWRYIRQHHGDLYGVGWDRVETTAEALLSTPKGSGEA